MKTAISIPDALFESAERLAARLGLSRSEVYQRALARYLEENSDESITQSLNRIYSADPDESQLDPVLDALQIASLGTGEDW